LYSFYYSRGSKCITYNTNTQKEKQNYHKTHTVQQAQANSISFPASAGKEKAGMVHSVSGQ